MSNQDDLAYGGYYQGAERGSKDGSRGLGDTFKKLRDTYKNHQGSSHGQSNQTYNPSGYQGQSYPTQNQPSQYGYDQQNQSTGGQNQNPDYYGKPAKEDKLSGFLGKLQGTVTGFGSEFAQKIGTTLDPQAYAEYGPSKPSTEHRFGSFAPPREHNDAKWYVDGCSYFWAVSRALENARESVWILDWWLSPELYLRRPPAKNEQYRLDRMLQAAAQRGVRVNIIVYKEVTQALTLSSAHTKHVLEALHPNIAVFRHPDHLPDRQELAASLASSFQNISLDPVSLSKMSKDTLKALYGMNDDVILYWAHHEKLCLIDGRIAFMGGLDMCFGRWDTNQHELSDLHPSDVNQTVFPGQDYNNSRVLDFQDVPNWENNQLDRKTMSRMGWSDISVSLHGAVVEDLRRHFVERWNFIYDAKYKVRSDTRYARLALHGRPTSGAGQLQAGSPQPNLYPSGQSSPQGQPPAPSWQTKPSGVASTTYPPPLGQTSANQYQQSQSQSQSQPQSQPQQQHSAGSNQPYSSASTPTYPPPPAQTPGSYEHSQSQSQPQTTAGSYQHYQGGNTSTHSPPPAQTSSNQPQYQQQPNTSSPYQPGSPSAYPPPPSQNSPGYPGQPSQSSHSPSQGHSPYTYTGDSFPPPPSGPPPAQTAANAQYQPYPQGQQGQQSPYFPPPPGQETSHSNTRGIDENQYQGDLERGSLSPRRFREDLTQYGNSLRGQLAGQIHQYQDKLTTYGRPSSSQARGNMSCQIVRSCAKWSNGSQIEHSIADAYCAIIRNSEHFIYIENQFFITATGDSQLPVKNKIGAAIVERILRAARAGQKYKIIVVIPSVPCFAGDLRDDETLGTRAIMEFQYNSINRGGHSIMELIAKEGFNPMEYIRFYNLRNYDRINNGSMMAAAEQQSGVNYEDARRQYDVNTAGPGGYAPSTTRTAFDTTAPFQKYQQAAHQVQGAHASSNRWDSVSECYMLGGEDIRKVPWDGHPDAEIDAFVSEELYVHSKVMIADDRVVVCGSANLNDRSQLGDHDSEIAVIIEDFTPVSSNMNGKPWTASRFASSLRRQLFRKHLGLLPPQDYQRPDANTEPVGVPNEFDFECPESKVVADPLSDTVQSLWNSRAHTNSEVFRKVFHAVPDDSVRNWNEYKEFYEFYFHKTVGGKDEQARPARFQWGHVVRDDFAPGAEGAKQVKELLSQVKGTLVEMPLMFLIEEDIAKEGLTLNDLTEPLYT
ncbi:Phospholipase D/Transphosphatidylase [Penicillium paradoxum]|uniref:Phospholipase D/Transphosphatidylase n=1 Tax=Penicillium paradoxum TaxID=176176 RepID=UPI0025487A66|nr:Phospholipase D/Transphosphatidylase [Penicillium paradoxum]KAJ5782519.1 Phospholipase D/Transphosphatidylase [Penicillium paradoxum]